MPTVLLTKAQSSTLEELRASGARNPFVHPVITQPRTRLQAESNTPSVTLDRPSINRPDSSQLLRRVAISVGVDKNEIPKERLFPINTNCDPKLIEGPPVSVNE